MEPWTWDSCLLGIGRVVNVLVVLAQAVASLALIVRRRQIEGATLLLDSVNGLYAIIGIASAVNSLLIMAVGGTWEVRREVRALPKFESLLGGQQLTLTLHEITEESDGSSETAPIQIWDKTRSKLVPTTVKIKPRSPITEISQNKRAVNEALFKAMPFAGLPTHQLKGQRLIEHIDTRLRLFGMQGNPVFSVPILANTVAMVFVLVISVIFYLQLQVYPIYQKWIKGDWRWSDISRSVFGLFPWALVMAVMHTHISYWIALFYEFGVIMNGHETAAWGADTWRWSGSWSDSLFVY